MWVVIYIAEGCSPSERLRALLEDEGIVVRVRPVYKNVPAEKNNYQIAVLEEETGAAGEVLAENGF